MPSLDDACHVHIEPLADGILLRGDEPEKEIKQGDGEREERDSDGGPRQRQQVLLDMPSKDPRALADGVRRALLLSLVVGVVFHNSVYLWTRGVVWCGAWKK